MAKRERIKQIKELAAKSPRLSLAALSDEDLRLLVKVTGNRGIDYSPDLSYFVMLKTGDVTDEEIERAKEVIRKLAPKAIQVKINCVTVVEPK